MVQMDEFEVEELGFGSDGIGRNHRKFFFA